MTLIDLWLNSPDQISTKQLHQIIAFAGEGRLRDLGDASSEFREFLARIPSDLLERYASECLATSFPDSGQALQDIVNQVGGRLGLDVTYGRYRGTTAHIGHDGLWRLPNGHSIVIEVKTTDAYRIALDTIAEYRRALIGKGQMEEKESSILIVVGRQDTGDLEAQIRGSRHAWDIRLISADALLRLMSVKEDLEDPNIVHRIHQILLPREFTRLDDIVDVLFSTAKDIKQDEEGASADGDEASGGSTEKKFTPVAFHRGCVERIARHLGMAFLKRSRATFATAEDDVRLLCAVSRTHQRSGNAFFWFALHPHQQEFLEAAPRALIAFGCGSPEAVLLVPFEEFRPWIADLNVTDTGDRRYSHVHVVQEGGSFRLLRRGGLPPVDLTKHFVEDSTT